MEGWRREEALFIRPELGLPTPITPLSSTHSPCGCAGPGGSPSVPSPHPTVNSEKSCPRFGAAPPPPSSRAALATVFLSWGLGGGLQRGVRGNGREPRPPSPGVPGREEAALWTASGTLASPPGGPSLLFCRTEIISVSPNLRGTGGGGDSHWVVSAAVWQVGRARGYYYPLPAPSSAPLPRHLQLPHRSLVVPYPECLSPVSWVKPRNHSNFRFSGNKRELWDQPDPGDRKPGFESRL